LPGFDYSTSGAYFITICTQNRESRFGEIIEGEMHLNPAGRMVEKCWLAMQERFEMLHIDEYIVMPNHFHAALFILDIPAAVKAKLFHIVGAFKSITSVEYIHGVNGLGWPPFDRQLWQRNFYDHIIRNQRSLDAIRLYIRNNPANWELDRINLAYDNR
jgi:REP element-mobilizing transposase RayT